MTSFTFKMLSKAAGLRIVYIHYVFFFKELMQHSGKNAPVKSFFKDVAGI